MSDTAYLRPIGLVPAGRRDTEAGFAGALPLCGDGPFDFTAIEIIRRQGNVVTRRRFRLGEIWDSDADRALTEQAATLERLTSARRRIAGLPMDRPQLMGVINVTPDSFSDGGQLGTAKAAIEHGLRLAGEGAAILDIGGESTRPGSDPTPIDVELARVIPVIEGLAERTDALISIDTRKAEVMRCAIAAGAGLINDITALGYDPEAMAVAAESGLPVCLMHTLGDSKTMQDDPRYDDVLTDVYAYLDGRIAACEDAGIPRERILVDPGIGFGKTFDHNLQLLAGLALYHGLGCPVLLGASRKRFVGVITGEKEAGKRVLGSVGAAIAGACQGVQVIRVHDVKATRDALAVWKAATDGRYDAP